MITKRHQLAGPSLPNNACSIAALHISYIAVMVTTCMLSVVIVLHNMEASSTKTSFCRKYNFIFLSVRNKVEYDRWRDRQSIASRARVALQSGRVGVFTTVHHGARISSETKRLRPPLQARAHWRQRSRKVMLVAPICGKNKPVLLKRTYTL